MKQYRVWVTRVDSDDVILEHFLTAESTTEAFLNAFVDVSDKYKRLSVPGARYTWNITTTNLGIKNFE